MKDFCRTVNGRLLPPNLVNVGTDDRPIIIPILLAESMMVSETLDEGHKSHISNEYDRIFKKMRTDEKIDGKVVFECDSCGTKEVGGKLADWTKEGTYQPQTKPEKPLYFCPKCSEERK